MARPLPFTLVTGFLGAGKTSLLHYLVSEHAGGHLAILLEQTDELGLDAKALRGLCGATGRKFDMVEEMADATQLVGALEEIAKGGRHEHILMESSGLTLPSYWIRALKSRADLVRVDNVVALVDLLDFTRAARAGARLDFIRVQVEAASVIVLNKCDLASEAERDEALRQLRAMNSAAQLIDTAYGEVRNLIRPPGATTPGSADLPSVKDSAPVSLPPLESVVYRAAQPFHPRRFWDWFNAPHEGLVRVKGMVWLATRNLLVGGISRAGVQNSAGAAGIWWAALPREEWPTDPARLMEMQATWTEPYGDRRQELVLVGARGPTSDAARKLNLCLLTDEEYARPDWRDLPDPFPAWDLDE